MRLIDPEGYTVPGTAQTVPDADEPAERRRLLTEVAPQHAAHWQDFGYHASAYRVLPVRGVLRSDLGEEPAALCG
ncbi:hypothetical protein DMH12_37335, partial [Streptomyces sp. WAC 04229]